MSALIINPGTGPVPAATELQATANMAVFCDDLRSMGVDVASFFAGIAGLIVLCNVLF
jgi:hypothetical protein